MYHVPAGIKHFGVLYYIYTHIYIHIHIIYKFKTPNYYILTGTWYGMGFNIRQATFLCTNNHFFIWYVPVHYIFKHLFICHTKPRKYPVSQWYFFCHTSVVEWGIIPLIEGVRFVRGNLKPCAVYPYFNSEFFEHYNTLLKISKRKNLFSLLSYKYHYVK